MLGLLRPKSHTAYWLYKDNTEWNKLRKIWAVHWAHYVLFHFENEKFFSNREWIRFKSGSAVCFILNDLTKTSIDIKINLGVAIQSIQRASSPQGRESCAMRARKKINWRAQIISINLVDIMEDGNNNNKN